MSLELWRVDLALSLKILHLGSFVAMTQPGAPALILFSTYKIGAGLSLSLGCWVRVWRCTDTVRSVPAGGIAASLVDCSLDAMLTCNNFFMVNNSVLQSTLTLVLSSHSVVKGHGWGVGTHLRGVVRASPLPHTLRLLNLSQRTVSSVDARGDATVTRSAQEALLLPARRPWRYCFLL